MNVVAWSVSLLILFNLNNYLEAKDPIAYTFDYSCTPKSCSQNKRSYENDHEFHCIIGQQKECDTFITSVQDDWLESQNNNYAKLTHIAVYARTNDQISKFPYQSLNLTMVLPNKDEGALKATSIYAIFGSFSGLQQDSYYSQHHKCRLFDFKETKLGAVDLQHPREINYPCFVGLDETTTRVNYFLNLTVYPFQSSIIYHITTHSEIPSKDRWLLTTAIASLKLLNKIHVVFEKSPLQVKEYVIRLYRNSNVAETIKVNAYVNEYEFDIQEIGKYYIGITPVTDGGMVNETLTRSITCNLIIYEEIKSRINDSALTIIAVIVSVLMALIIVTILYCHVTNPKRNEITRNNKTAIEDDGIGIEMIPVNNTEKDDEDNNMVIVEYKDIIFK